MDDIQFLTFIRNRLVNVYKESDLTDFVQRLDQIIKQKRSDDIIIADVRKALGDIRRSHSTDSVTSDLIESLSELVSLSDETISGVTWGDNLKAEKDLRKRWGAAWKKARDTLAKLNGKL